jgi:hypothetical protein
MIQMCTERVELADESDPLEAKAGIYADRKNFLDIDLAFRLV